jgi:hypothetical protein
MRRYKPFYGSPTPRNPAAKMAGARSLGGVSKGGKMTESGFILPLNS